MPSKLIRGLTSWAAIAPDNISDLGDREILSMFADSGIGEGYRRELHRRILRCSFPYEQWSPPDSICELLTNPDTLTELEERLSLENQNLVSILEYGMRAHCSIDKAIKSWLVMIDPDRSLNALKNGFLRGSKESYPALLLFILEERAHAQQTLSAISEVCYWIIHDTDVLSGLFEPNWRAMMRDPPRELAIARELLVKLSSIFVDYPTGRVLESIVNGIPAEILRGGVITSETYYQRFWIEPVVIGYIMSPLQPDFCAKIQKWKSAIEMYAKPPVMLTNRWSEYSGDESLFWADVAIPKLREKCPHNFGTMDQRIEYLQDLILASEYTSDFEFPVRMTNLMEDSLEGVNGLLRGQRPQPIVDGATPLLLAEWITLLMHELKMNLDSNPSAHRLFGILFGIALRDQIPLINHIDHAYLCVLAGWEPYMTSQSGKHLVSPEAIHSIVEGFGIVFPHEKFAKLFYASELKSIMIAPTSVWLPTVISNTPSEVLEWIVHEIQIATSVRLGAMIELSERKDNEKNGLTIANTIHGLYSSTEPEYFLDGVYEADFGAWRNYFIELCMLLISHGDMYALSILPSFPLRESVTFFKLWDKVEWRVKHITAGLDINEQLLAGVEPGVVGYIALYQLTTSSRLLEYCATLFNWIPLLDRYESRSWHAEAMRYVYDSCEIWKSPEWRARFQQISLGSTELYRDILRHHVGVDRVQVCKLSDYDRFNDSLRIIRSTLGKLSAAKPVRIADRPYMMTQVSYRIFNYMNSMHPFVSETALALVSAEPLPIPDALLLKHMLSDLVTSLTNGLWRMYVTREQYDGYIQQVVKIYLMLSSFKYARYIGLGGSTDKPFSDDHCSVAGVTLTDLEAIGVNTDGLHISPTYNHDDIVTDSCIRRKIVDKLRTAGVLDSMLKLNSIRDIRVLNVLYFLSKEYWATWPIVAKAIGSQEMWVGDMWSLWEQLGPTQPYLTQKIFSLFSWVFNDTGTREKSLPEFIALFWNFVQNSSAELIEAPGSESRLFTELGEYISSDRRMIESVAGTHEAGQALVDLWDSLFRDDVLGDPNNDDLEVFEAKAVRIGPYITQYVQWYPVFKRGEWLDQYCSTLMRMKSFIRWLDVRGSEFWTDGTASGILYSRCPLLIRFAKRLDVFRSELAKSRGGKPALERLNMKRKHILDMTFNKFEGIVNIHDRSFEVRFLREEGVDAGGLTREWFTDVVQALLTPERGLFVQTDSNTYKPYWNSAVKGNHLEYFRFAGRFIGKALLDGQAVPAYFTKSFLRFLLDGADSDVIFDDYADEYPEENELYNRIAAEGFDVDEGGLADMTFAVTMVSMDGRGEQVDLRPSPNSVNEDSKLDVEDVYITNQNRKEYVDKARKFKLKDSIADQIREFVNGFHSVIPQYLIQGKFLPQELGVLIAGMPDIDTADLRKHTVYAGYKTDSEPVQMFWAVFDTLTVEERVLFLKFVTGSSQVPTGGFANLKEGSDRMPSKFRISWTTLLSEDGVTVLLPSAHTCFNQLDLPPYRSEVELKTSLLIAITKGTSEGGFGFI